MLHDVHVFAVVRIKVKDIEADTHHDAIKKAIDQTDFYALLGGNDMEFGEEFSHYLVNEVGDEKFERSKYYGDACHWDVRDSSLQYIDMWPDDTAPPKEN